MGRFSFLKYTLFVNCHLSPQPSRPASSATSIFTGRLGFVPIMGAVLILVPGSIGASGYVWRCRAIQRRVRVCGADGDGCEWNHARPVHGHVPRVSVREEDCAADVLERGV
ncbi:LOW QUALITY PROTEIN: hypothetical protein BC937DRAFT_87071 [Endogone sp. FLAS-F59071]|nr:LOW QUALITY PROTEIN: hypothetical protein BC937DRAFT_87071 [Endogone sp. FLAS-F59071]|eukprot:RUS12767.1 LOW QUALITY PROTEIN: hypothetical protein BC937DRAFT_87071 [Endogone sp. FLAS-F59071]